MSQNDLEMGTPTGGHTSVDGTNDGDTSSIHSMSVASHHEPRSRNGSTHTPTTKRYEFGPGIGYDDDDDDDLDDIEAHNNAVGSLDKDGDGDPTADAALEFDEYSDDDFDSLPMRTVGMTSSAGGLLKRCLTSVTPTKVSSFLLKNSVLVTIIVLLILALIAVGIIAKQIKTKEDDKPLSIKNSTGLKGDKIDWAPNDGNAPATPPPPPLLPEHYYNIHDHASHPTHLLLQRVIGKDHAKYFRLAVRKEGEVNEEEVTDNKKNVYSRVFDAKHGAFEDAGIKPNHPRYAKLTDTFTIETIEDGTKDVKEVFVLVNGTTNVALSAGAYWYLKYVAGCQVTWGENGSGNQFATLPPLNQNLPKIEKRHLENGGIPRKPVDLRNYRTPKAGGESDESAYTCEDAAPTTGIFRATAPVRYAWNMCTFSYSATWWNKARWRQEIDWMALHGVNMPLALNAQEYVWYKVFTKHYNITLEELQTWFSGPAFFAWQRAGNVRGFGGPLPLHFMEDQRDLQTFILTEMRKLDMKPILPCFGGHIPAAFAKHFPDATISQSEGWNHFPPDLTKVYYLDPTDEHYHELGKHYIDEQTALFGTDHFYSCDTFNEVDPPTNDEDYLADAAKAVLDGITASDNEGVWVMQAWLFHFNFWQPPQVKAYISGIKNPDDLLILDLNSEEGILASKFGDFHGKPWVWNLLHNYGGVRGMYGSLHDLSKDPFKDMYIEPNTWGGTRDRSNMVGIGFTPEAIEQNPIMYEMLTDSFWYQHREAVTTCTSVEDPASSVAIPDAFPVASYDKYGEEYKLPIDDGEWVKQYVTQRYGLQEFPNEEPSADEKEEKSSRNEHFVAAWQELVRAVYNQHGHPRTEMERKPKYPYDDYGWYKNGNPTGMVTAFKKFMYAIEQLKKVMQNKDGGSTFEESQAAEASLKLGTLSYDLVDITRQATTYFFTAAHRAFHTELNTYFTGEYNSKTKETSHSSDRQLAARHAIPKLRKLLSGLFVKLDTLYDHDANYQLSTRWINPAIECANKSDANELATFLFNAKNQITQWGPDSQIDDYACKAWSGLYREYYMGRWNILLDNAEWVANNISAEEDAKDLSGFRTRVYPNTEWKQWDVDAEITKFEKFWSKNNDALVKQVMEQYKQEMNVKKGVDDLEENLNHLSDELEKDTEKMEKKVEGMAEHEEEKMEEAFNTPNPAGHRSASASSSGTTSNTHLSFLLRPYDAAIDLMKTLFLTKEEFNKLYVKFDGRKRLVVKSHWSGAIVRLFEPFALGSICNQAVGCVGFSSTYINRIITADNVELEDRSPNSGGMEEVTYAHRAHCSYFIPGCQEYIEELDKAGTGSSTDDEDGDKNNGGGGDGSGNGGGDNVIPVNGKGWNTPAPDGN